MGIVCSCLDPKRGQHTNGGCKCLRKPAARAIVKAMAEAVVADRNELTAGDMWDLCPRNQDICPQLYKSEGSLKTPNHCWEALMLSDEDVAELYKGIYEHLGQLSVDSFNDLFKELRALRAQAKAAGALRDAVDSLINENMQFMWVVKSGCLHAPDNKTDVHYFEPVRQAIEAYDKAKGGERVEGD